MGADTETRHTSAAPQATAVPTWKLRREMIAAGFSGGTHGVFLRYVEGRQAGEVHLRPRGRGIEIDSLFTLDRFRKRNLGSRMLADVCAVADRLRAPLALTPCPIGETGLDLSGLVSWYGRHGFEVRDDPQGRGGLRMFRASRRPHSPSVDMPPVSDPTHVDGNESFFP